jgi:RimJ/RimL family protein N-acetyltransferase
MTRAVPHINTSRLTLRAMRLEDFDRYAEIWADRDVARYITGQPRSRGQSWAAFLRNAGQWQMTGYGQWAVIEHATGRMIGQAGFFNGARDLGDDFDAYPEAGWLLAPEAHGKGLGTEAVKAVHEWYDRVIPGSLVATVDRRNAVSLKMAETTGYSALREVKMGRYFVQLLRRDKVPQR